jgi:AcrR family transcriptional regulator
LLRAAREVFAESGFDGSTVRAIAARAGVDAAMVNHWFGGKEGLFAQAVLKLPFDPRELAGLLLDGDPGTIGERIVRTFVTRWDGAGGQSFAALIRSIAGHEESMRVLRETLMKHVFARVVAVVAPDRHDLRAGLCATQLLGLGMTRYVAEFEPIAKADLDTLVPAIAPALQRYLTGDIG